jgi:hypothetical protein
MLFNSMETVPCIQRKAEWAIKWIKSRDAQVRSLGLSILLFRRQGHVVRRTSCRVRRGRGDLLLRFFLRHFLAQEARFVKSARLQLLQLPSTHFTFFLLGLMPGLTFSNELISRDEGDALARSSSLRKPRSPRFTGLFSCVLVQDCTRTLPVCSTPRCASEFAISHPCRPCRPFVLALASQAAIPVSSRGDHQVGRRNRKDVRGKLL